MRLLFSCLLLAAVGCSKSSPNDGRPNGTATALPPTSAPMTKAAVKPVPVQAAVVEKKVGLDSLPQTTSVKYQGRNAAEWGAELLDADSSVSGKAGFALSHLGNENLRFCAEGMKSHIEHVRYFSVRMFDGYGAIDHKDVFVPLLIALLADKSPRVREFAAIRISGCKFKECAQAMQDARDNEQDATLKKTISETLATLQKN